MNCLQLVSHLRLNILHDTGGEGAEWETFSDENFDSIQLRWRNEELVANINQAINVVYRRTNPVKDVDTMSILATVSTYPLPTYCLEVTNAKLANGKALGEVSVDDLWNNQEFFTNNKEPSYYMSDMTQSSIVLYPTPVVNTTLTYLFYRLPKVPLDWNNPTASPELREEFQLPMLFYAAHLCYMKDEANVLDSKRAADFLSLFDLEFPPLSAYGTMRKAKTSNRAISYGGIGSPNFGRSRSNLKGRF